MIAVGYWGSIFQGIVVNCEGYPSETSYWRMRWLYYLFTNSFPTDRWMLSRYQYFLTLLRLRSILAFSSVQFISVTQSCPTLCNPMNCSTPGLPVHHQLLEFTQTHDHWVDDAIQQSHPLSSPSPPSLNLSQHQGLFKWVNSLHEVAKVLEFQASTSVLPMNTEDWSPLGWTDWISLEAKGLSRVFSNTTVQKHQFFGTQLSL